ncbi:hypothetical protein B0H14DRAFT_2187934, partial [Mycena olivaceomarginata]
RVCEVVLHGDTTFTLHQQNYKASDALKPERRRYYSTILPIRVDAFLTSHPPSSHGNRDLFAEPTSDVVHLGLTFSFP